MGFFSDLKEDLSQAVNELLPDETSEVSAEPGGEVRNEEAQEQETTDVTLEEMLKNIDAIPLTEVNEDREESEDATALVEESFAQNAEWEEEASAEEILEEPGSIPGSELFAESLYSEENAAENKGAEKKMEGYVSRAVSDETSIITAGMIVAGDIISEGSVEVIGTINGNIDILGKLNVTGHITGNSKASEIYAEGAKINGEIVSEGAVKIGASSVVIGNIVATSAAIAGAVKGDIDVRGPVILDASAIVMGNIKSKSVQINNGAVIEGMCSQCYAEVSPTSFFDDYKPENKKAK